MQMLRINGVDLTPYIRPDMSFSWGALDGENAGRNLSGDMDRDYIADKEKFEIALAPLDNAKFWQFSDMLKGGHDLSVEYRGASSSTLRNITCYCTSFGGSCHSTADDKPLWINTTFNLIEK